ncbi:MAG: helix-turn-helix transcriptional regulator [Caldilineaceae bacterium]|nr:helix-turn-helix transcriptional regulator [Caldilineaceae bacterium]
MIAPTPTPEALRAQRTRAGLTQESAAALLGVSRRSIAGWETGERDMPRPLWTLFLMLTTEKGTQS